MMLFFLVMGIIILSALLVRMVRVVDKGVGVMCCVGHRTGLRDQAQPRAAAGCCLAFPR